MEDDKEEHTMEYVMPGQKLGHQDEFEAGEGTYYRLEYIHASLAGYKHVREAETPSGRRVVEITRDKESTVIVPKIGDVVTCRVTRITPRLAHVEILCVGLVPTKDRYAAVIRVQDVRATEIDKVQIFLSFRPGDIVRALVVFYLIFIFDLCYFILF